MNRVIKNPAQRKALYGIVTAVMAGLIAFNVITADQVSDIVSQAITLLTAATTLLAYLNTDNGDDVVPFTDDDVL